MGFIMLYTLVFVYHDQGCGRQIKLSYQSNNALDADTIPDDGTSIRRFAISRDR